VSAKLDNIPVLEGWVNLTEAAEQLGISRQHAYKMAKLANEGKRGGWRTLHQLGTKPSYVVSTQEILDRLTEKQRSDADEQD
jgi:hypothetical protein